MPEARYSPIGQLAMRASQKIAKMAITNNGVYSVVRIPFLKDGSLITELPRPIP